MLSFITANGTILFMLILVTTGQLYLFIRKTIIFNLFNHLKCVIITLGFKSCWDPILNYRGLESLNSWLDDFIKMLFDPTIIDDILKLFYDYLWDL